MFLRYDHISDFFLVLRFETNHLKPHTHKNNNYNNSQK